MADTFTFPIQSQNMPPFEHDEMEATFQLFIISPNMPPFVCSKMAQHVFYLRKWAAAKARHIRVQVITKLLQQ
jgi:hypothetical protein